MKCWITLLAWSITLIGYTNDNRVMSHGTDTIFPTKAVCEERVPLLVKAMMLNPAKSGVPDYKQVLFTILARNRAKLEWPDTGEVLLVEWRCQPL